MSSSSDTLTLPCCRRPGWSETLKRRRWPTGCWEKLHGWYCSETNLKKLKGKGKNTSRMCHCNEKADENAGESLGLWGNITYVRLEPWGCMVGMLRPETTSNDEMEPNSFEFNKSWEIAHHWIPDEFWIHKKQACKWKAATLETAHHSGVVVVGFDRQTGHGAVDPLLLLTPITEPNSNHLLLHGELLRDERYLLRVGFWVLENKTDLKEVSTSGQELRNACATSCPKFLYIYASWGINIDCRSTESTESGAIIII